MPHPIRRLAPALALTCTVSVGATACGSGSAAEEAAVYITAPTPSPTTQDEREDFARARFAATAGLAAGAAYRWIVKPWKDGVFDKGAQGRAAALDKAGLAGTFAYNKLKTLQRNAQGDPELVEDLAPLLPELERLKDLPAKLRAGDESAIRTFDKTIGKVRGVGSRADAHIRVMVPTESQLAAG
ncbi:hypothetical protein NGF19_22785 [Streptomyces sp. RY43-2]|uniref:Uncharacterized protein n=1 Tax=Streptomyces macrolidinus TaxID=2952607 RepID=A0ABT0ZJ24_9ACTN|nr:hypothetical protein [Streptomyces macrolidinus]MCN9243579.1 hypothetical protein [Streptomyces macrolidinus]